MGRIEKTVFISYRRKDLPWALAVYQNLFMNGFDIFFDYNSIKSGDFEQIILQNIRGRAHFVVLLSPTSLERCNEPGDWLRREIETALLYKRNIVPLFFEGFSFTNPAITKFLTGQLANISRYNGFPVYAEYFDAAMTRLRSEFLNVALDAVLHPISSSVLQAVKVQKAEANKAEKVDKKELLTREHYEFKSIALGENSSWVVFYGRNGYSWSGIPAGLAKKIQEVYEQGHEFQSITLGPNSSWVFQYKMDSGGSGSWWEGIPPILAQELEKVYKQGYAVKSVALGPDASWVYFYGHNGFSWRGIPDGLAKKIDETIEKGHTLESVFLGPDSNWVLVYRLSNGNNGAWWAGITADLEKKFQGVYKEGYGLKSVALGPNLSWTFIYGYNAYWCNNVPNEFFEKLQSLAGDV